MSIQEKETIEGSKSRDSTPPSHPDLEIGNVEVAGVQIKDGDEALGFLKNQHDVVELTADEKKKLVRKIDWMIMPLMWCCYCLQYLDKTLGMAPCIY